MLQTFAAKCINSSEKLFVNVGDHNLQDIALLHEGLLHCGFP